MRQRVDPLRRPISGLTKRSRDQWVDCYVHFNIAVAHVQSGVNWILVLDVFYTARSSEMLLWWRNSLQADVTLLLPDGGILAVGQRAGRAVAQTREVVFISTEVLTLGPDSQREDKWTIKHPTVWVHLSYNKSQVYNMFHLLHFVWAELFVPDNVPDHLQFIWTHKNFHQIKSAYWWVICGPTVSYHMTIYLRVDL